MTLSQKFSRVLQAAATSDRLLALLQLADMKAWSDALLISNVLAMISISERRTQSEAGKKELQPNAKKPQTWGDYSNVSIHFSIIYMLKTISWSAVAEAISQSIPTHHPETFKVLQFQWLS